MRYRGRGFTYHVTPERLYEYQKWPIARRLRWLYLANKMRRSFPKKTLEIQDAFRRGDLGLGGRA